MFNKRVRWMAAIGISAVFVTVVVLLSGKLFDFELSMGAFRVKIQVAGVNAPTAKPFVSNVQPLVNVALRKPARQSSNIAQQPLAMIQASNAVDGNYNGNWQYDLTNSISHTAEQATPWWEVDLGSVFTLDTISIWNRTDCCVERLSNFYIMVSDSPFTSDTLSDSLAQPGVTVYYIPGVAAPTTRQPVHRTGRYVRIQLSGTNYLSLTEVEVMAASDTAHD